jgi:poly-beta-1,6-N-acetyl-D-glucosamine synthase
MKALFWTSAAMIAYTYVGYPLLLWLKARFAPRPVRPREIFPFVSIVIAVHNEAQRIPRKIANLAEVDYPRDRFEVIFSSEGSTDETVETLHSRATGACRYVVLQEHRGKAAALRLGIESAKGEIIVFTDARQQLAPGTLKNLVSNFADPDVGAVSGELLLGKFDSASLDGQGIGLYWRIEKSVRKWEAMSGSMIGLPGALYGVRRDLLVPAPEGTILDDLFVALSVCRLGSRVIYDSRACVWDDMPYDVGREFRRKVRTLTGNYQLLQIAPWILTTQNKVLFSFISHKLLRLIVPIWLVGIFVSSLFLSEPFYRGVLIAQIVCYGLSFLAYFVPNIPLLSKIANAGLTFVMLNAAAVVALFNFISRRKDVWVTQREEAGSFRRT